MNNIIDKDAPQATLRKSGYKATKPRLAILSLFQRSKKPLSAQEIIAALPAHPAGMRIDQATVYRTLKSLNAKGIIHPIDLRHNHAHYELTNIAEHHHLICLRCGRIEDIQRCDIEGTQNAILRGSKHFIEIRQHTLEFYGVCRSCARKDGEVEIATHKTAPR